MFRVVSDRVIRDFKIGQQFLRLLWPFGGNIVKSGNFSTALIRIFKELGYYRCFFHDDLSFYDAARFVIKKSLPIVFYRRYSDGPCVSDR